MFGKAAIEFLKTHLYPRVGPPYAYTPIERIGSSSFNGDTFSTQAKTLINLSSEFSGIPDGGIYAVNVEMLVQDSASASTNTYLILSPNNTAGSGPRFNAGYMNSLNMGHSAIIKCNDDGNIYYQTVASGSNTMKLYLYITGYWV